MAYFPKTIQKDKIEIQSTLGISIRPRQSKACEADELTKKTFSLCKPKKIDLDRKQRAVFQTLEIWKPKQKSECETAFNSIMGTIDSTIN